MITTHLDVNAASPITVHRAATARAAVGPHKRRNVHHRPLAKLSLVDTARNRQQLITYHLSLQTTDRHAMQQSVFRIHSGAGPIRFTRLPVRAREHNLPNHVLHRPVVIHDLRRKIVQKFRVCRRLAGRAKVVDCLNDAAAEQMMPNAIYRNTRNKRIIRINHPLSQAHPAAATLGSVGHAQRLKEGAWYQFLGRCAVVAPNEHWFVLAVAVKQRQRPNCIGNHSLYVGPSLVIGGKLRRCFVKISWFFEKIIVPNHPVEQLRRFTIHLSRGTIVGRIRQHLR